MIQEIDLEIDYNVWKCRYCGVVVEGRNPEVNNYQCDECRRLKWKKKRLRN